MAEVIVVAGGIGSGKSTVTKRLDIYMPTINADEIANSYYKDLNHPVTKKVIQFFGEDIVVGNEVSRIELRAKLTSTYDYQLLGDLFSQSIRADLAAFKEENNDRSFVAMEIPLAIESKWACDYLVAVVAPKNSRIDRVMARSKLDFKDILLRMECQATLEQTIDTADFVIVNNSTQEHLEKRVDVLYYGLLYS